MNILKKQHGIALLEVLIAFVIVTVSVVALYQLQNKYLRNEITTSTRLTALHIAESKLDDLRTFSGLTISGSLPTYDSIGDNTGGKIAAGTVSSGNANVGNYVYDLSWSVTDNGGSKDVDVTVSWNGGDDEIRLSGSIARVQKISEDRLTSSSTVEKNAPVVEYTAGVAPDVISVDVDDSGTKQETTKPLPEVANSGGSISSQFSTITYYHNPDDPVSNTQVESDFNTISCSCTYTSEGSAPLSAYPYLTDTDLLYWKVGSLESKRRGVVANNQPTLCDVCCENHFDNAENEAGAFSDYYNQFNRNAEKYRYNGSSLNAVTSGGYIDSCRLLRIDGYYRPMPDWNLVKLNVMSASYLSDTENVAKYQAYIKDVVKAYVVLAKSVTWGNSIANRDHFGVASSYVDTSQIPSFQKWLQDHNYSSTNLTMALGDTPIQLIARGIFIDLLNTADVNNDDESVSSAELDADDPALLKKVPFYDINMTLLSRWESGGSSVSVANEAIKTLDSSDADYYGVYPGRDHERFLSKFRRFDLQIEL